jgi:hypothetical protein
MALLVLDPDFFDNRTFMYFGDLVGSLVDPLAAELVFLPETVVGLASK